MSAHRPAGFSDEDDEDSDYDSEFSSRFDKDPKFSKQTHLQEKSETKESRFYSALTSREKDVMSSMLDEGFHVDQPLAGGWSPLMHACFHGSFPIVQFLIKKGANVNFNKELFTPLMALCKSSSSKKSELVQCFDLLLENKANVNAVDRHATTALMNACNAGHVELVKKLIEHDCDVNIQDTLGRSALFHAVNEGQEEIVHVLVERKARTDLIDKQRRSAFDLAVFKGYEQLSKLLCSKKEQRRLTEEFDCSTVAFTTTKDPVEELFDQLPDSRVKTGFSVDIGKLLNAMGLRHFIKLFEEKNVHLVEFLLITDEELKALGVTFSVHRQCILSSIRKFHVHNWNKVSLGMKPRNKNLDVTDGVKLVCNVTKHLHVLNATLNYIRIHQPVSIYPRVFKISENVRHQLDLISCELSAIQSFASSLREKEKLEPVDLIKPKRTNRKYFPLFAATVFIGLTLWRKQIFLMFK